MNAFRTDRISAPPWPKAYDFAHCSSHCDEYGNVLPLVGYQYRAECEYLRAWRAAAEPRIDALRVALLRAANALREAKCDTAPGTLSENRAVSQFCENYESLARAALEQLE